MWPTIYNVAAIILLSALSKGELPEDDFRIINRQDLLASNSDTFEDKSTRSFSQLLFDVARDQVIVGARDALFRLSLRELHQMERADWLASPEKTKLCQDKGQTEEDCHNYIKVLLSNGHQLFACGTHAFSPLCSWRELESLNTVSEYMSGIAHCPYNPHSNVTAILAGSGEYYAGTPTDFSSSDFAITKSRGASHRDMGMLRTTQYDYNWLNEPQFVGSFEDDHFVYFVYRETAVEHMNCGTMVYSRIARVCKNDSGGFLMMKDNWRTFIKARITCSVYGNVPFYYDEVQHVDYLPQEKILVATFTTPINSITGSAVCIYNMSDIHSVFDGPYKVQDSPTSTWETRRPTSQMKNRFHCGSESRTHEPIEYNRYHLMSNSVQPISRHPVYQVTSERFSHITVDVTSAKDIDKQYVLFVATESGNVLKLSVLPKMDGACLVEKWKLRDEQGGFEVLNMQFVKETMSVYIGSSTGVFRIGSERCSRFQSRAGCVGAGDPYCGWDDARELCVKASSRIRDPSFVQSTGVCPPQDTPVDGGWSSWSEWEPCMQDGTSHSDYGEKPDMCMCRKRNCDNPRPANGGNTCKGVSVSVSNCTVHGGWSSWSGWSECSATCGIAMKSRRRTCTSPEPRFGGRVCVGLDTDDIFCANHPPCPDPALAPVDGGWSTWGPWTQCSSAGGAGCGPSAGWRERRRTCSSPTPRHGGSDCDGIKIERAVCDMRACELRKATAWTPWVQIPGNTSDGSYTEKRFKFLCKAPSPEQIKLSIAREEERYCNARGTCSNTPPEEESGWEEWGPWEACTAACGGGQQTRRRRCKRPPCEGSNDMLRPCNTHDCSGEWSCWSEWSECSGRCGRKGSATPTGHRSRSRKCLSPQGCTDAAAALERRACLTTCAGEWSCWSEWSEYSGRCGRKGSATPTGHRSRSRKCLSPQGCTDAAAALKRHACLTTCAGEWSCWSEWSEYSGRCGRKGSATPTGHRSRSRKCLSPQGCTDAAAALERRACLTTCADSEAGWGEWGEWGPCENGERVRQRSCETGACLGAQLQAARCPVDDDDIDNELYAMPAYSQNVEMASFVTMAHNDSLSIGTIIGSVVAAFVMGCLLCLATVIVCQRRGSRMPWKKQTRVPSSPHYITAKQNSYVTVPLKDVPRKAKRQPSFTGIGGPSGIILSKSNNLSNANNHNTALATPKLYPKAIANEYDSVGTLRRHSNQPNNKNHMDVEEDKFY